MFAPSTSTEDVQQTPETVMDTSSDSDSDSIVHELPMGQKEEGELLDLAHNVSVTDQASTEEQNYRETMRCVRSYMGWTHILDIDSAASSAEENPLLHPNNS